MHLVLGRNLNIFFSEFFNESGYGLSGLDRVMGHPFLFRLKKIRFGSGIFQVASG